MKNILPATEENIKLTWGVSPLPANTIPVLVNRKITSRNYGLLMYNTKTNIFTVGAGNITHSIAKSEAERMIQLVDASDGHGGNREGAGRKCDDPSGKKKKMRSLRATDEEWAKIKEYARQIKLVHFIANQKEN